MVIGESFDGKPSGNNLLAGYPLRLNNVKRRTDTSSSSSYLAWTSSSALTKLLLTFSLAFPRSYTHVKTHGARRLFICLRVVPIRIQAYTPRCTPKRPGRPE